MKRMNTMRAAGIPLLAVLFGAMAQQQAFASSATTKISRIEIDSGSGVYYADPAKTGFPIQFKVYFADFADPLNPVDITVAVAPTSTMTLQLNCLIPVPNSGAYATINPADSGEALVFDYYPRVGDLSSRLAWRWPADNNRPFGFGNAASTVTLSRDGAGSFTANLTQNHITIGAPSTFDPTIPPATQVIVEGLGLQTERANTTDFSLANPVFAGTSPLAVTSNGNPILWPSGNITYVLWATDTAGVTLNNVTFRPANSANKTSTVAVPLIAGQVVNQLFYVDIPTTYSGGKIQIRLGIPGSATSTYIIRELDVITDPNFDPGPPQNPTLADFQNNLNVNPLALSFNQDAAGKTVDITYSGVMSSPRQAVIFPSPNLAPDAQSSNYVSADTIIKFSAAKTTSALFTLNTGYTESMLITPITGKYGVTRVRVALAGMETTFYKDFIVEVKQSQIRLSVVWQDPTAVPVIYERFGDQLYWSQGKAMLILNSPAASDLEFTVYGYDAPPADPSNLIPPLAQSQIFVMTDGVPTPVPNNILRRIAISQGSTNSAPFTIYGLDDKGANDPGTGIGTGYLYPVKTGAADLNSYDVRPLTVNIKNKAPVLLNATPNDSASYPGGTVVTFTFLVEDTVYDTLNYSVKFGDGKTAEGVVTRQRPNERSVIEVTHIYDANGPDNYTWTLDVWDDSNDHIALISRKILITQPQRIEITTYWERQWADLGQTPGFGWVSLKDYTVLPDAIAPKENSLVYRLIAGAAQTELKATAYLAGETQRPGYEIPSRAVSQDYDSFFYSWNVTEAKFATLITADNKYKSPWTLNLKTVGQLDSAGDTTETNVDAALRWKYLGINAEFVTEYLKEDNFPDHNLDGLPDAWALNYFGEAGRAQYVEGRDANQNPWGASRVAGDLRPRHGWDDARFGVGPNGFGRSGGSGTETSYIPHASQPMTYLDKARGRDNTTLNANGIGKNGPSNSSWFISIPNGANRQVIALLTTPKTGMDVTKNTLNRNGIVYDTATSSLVAADPANQAALDGAGMTFDPITGTITDPAGCILALQHDEVTNALFKGMSPLLADTDGDGLTDGWEYYFWYYASRIVHAPATDGTQAGVNASIYTELWPHVDHSRTNTPGWVTYPVVSLEPSGGAYVQKTEYVTRNFRDNNNLMRYWADGQPYFEGNQVITANGVRFVVRSGEKLVRNTDGTYIRERRTIADLGVNDTHPVALTAAQCPFVLGMAFNLNDPTVGIPIPAGKVMAAFNPIAGAAADTDTDGDGLSNLEEFALGTNPIHWDSDGDGMSDFWEVHYGLNPNDPGDADKNPDKDAMALYVDEDTGEILKHSAVFDRLGFNPLTGWLLNSRGWINHLPDNRSATVSIYPVNTVEFTNVEEYRSMVDNIRLKKSALSLDPKAERYIFKNSPSPISSDTDGDSVPDGWELYIGYSPTTATDSTSRVTERGAGGLWTARNEFSSLFSYLECTGRFDTPEYKPRLGSENITIVNWQWINKLLPTNPDPLSDMEIISDGTVLIGTGFRGKGLGGDTDQDGVMDNEEAIFPYFYGNGTRSFIYGDIPDVREARDSTLLNILNSQIGCYPGGGLNPTSMDTDLDGIPDGWEAQFAGRIGANGIVGGMNGTNCLDAYFDNDSDGLRNYQEYLTQLLRHTRYDLGEDSAPLNTFDPLTGKGFSAVNDLLGPSPELLNRWTMGEILASLANGLFEGEELRQGIVDTQVSMYEFYRDYYEGKLAAPSSGDAEFTRLTGLILIEKNKIETLKTSIKTAETERTAAEIAEENAWLRYFIADYNYTQAIKAGADQSAIDALYQLRADALVVYESAALALDGILNDLYLLNIQLIQAQSSLAALMAQRDARVEVLMNMMPGEAGYSAEITNYATRYYEVDQIIKGIEGDEAVYFSKLAERGFNGGVVINTFEWDPAAVPSNIGASGACYYLTPIGMHSTFEMLKKNDPFHAGNWLSTDFQIIPGVRPTYYGGIFVTTDPNMPDSDNDGMDDYFEVYHGLNPILGAADYAVRPEPGIRNIRMSVGVDRIASAYYGMVGPSQPSGGSPVFNNPFGNPSMATEGTGAAYDFYQYPWMAGLPYADPDADGISNAGEAVNPAPGAPGNTMTDPSPLWFTDPANPNSLVSRFYSPEGITHTTPSTFISNSTFFPNYWVPGGTEYFFPFEISEGFDTDVDSLGDGSEVTRGTSAQNQDSPYRRQAIYFDGTGALQTYTTFTHGPTSLRSFTVEAWVRPDRIGGEQVIIERSWMTEDAAYVTDPAKLPGMIRRNFRLGIDNDGKPYGLFTESASADSCLKITAPQTLKVGEWVHLAIRYAFDEGAVPSAAAKSGLFDLMINGHSVKSTRSSLIPATGILSYMPSFEMNIGNVYSYRSAPIFVGAAGLRPNDMRTMMADVDETAVMGDVYTDFFAGYIDEIRIWNGARTDAQITEWVNKIMPASYASTNRWDSFIKRYEGNGHYTVLPEAELVALYAFDTLFTATVAPGGAVTSQTEPAGMGARSLNVPDDPDSAEDSFFHRTVQPNLYSPVYTSHRYVPWLKNTVGHLPLMDVSVSYLYTMQTNYVATQTNFVERAEVNLTYKGPTKVSNSFYWTPHSTGGGRATNPMPIETNPYGYTYRTTLEFDPVTYWEQPAYTYRAVNDLLPLGGAYTRQVEMWDGSSSTILPPENLEEPENWATPEAPGSCRSAGEAFLEDYVRQGQTADSDGDGIPDWWENYFGFDALSDEDANGWFADPDGDGLYNYAEYRASTNPNAYSSTGKDLPDFHTALWDTRGKPTYGFLYTDHDFMEDAWERLYYPATSVDLHDPWKDPDNDGWSNWAEARANPRGFTHSTRPNRIETIIYGDKVIPEYPEPVLPVIFNYFGRKSVTNETAAVVVNTYTTPGMNGKPDATFRIPLTTARVQKTQVLGNLRTGVVQGVLDPGHIAPGTFVVRITRYVPAHGTTDYSIDEDDVLYFHDDLGGESPNGETGNILGTVIGLNENGQLYFYDVNYGTINYKTGEYTIELKEANVWSDTQTSVIGNVLTATYEYAIPTTEFPLSFSLVKPTFGHVREGRNYITAFIDYNSDGLWNSGEPAGMTDTLTVDVGWDRVEDIQIGLTDEAPPGTVRVELPADWLEKQGSASIVIYDENADGAPGAEVFRKKVVSPRSNIMEADIFVGTQHGYLPGSENPRVSEILYFIGYYLDEDGTNPKFFATATNHVRAIKTAAVVDPINSKVIGTSRPTIEWTCDLQPVSVSITVKKGTGNDIVYESGSIISPGPVKGMLTADGIMLNTYRMELPLNSGDVHPTAANGTAFNNGTYTVSILLKGPTNTKEISGSFYLDVVSSTNETTFGEHHSGYYKTRVIYNGVLQESALVSVPLRVRAYTTASFNGSPAGAATTKIMGSAASRDPVSKASVANVELTGLNITDTDGTKIQYYTMAFLDLNLNGTWERWEPWGYAIAGADGQYYYDAATSEAGRGPTASFTTVFIQDVDTDSDKLADSWEWAQAGSPRDNTALTSTPDFLKKLGTASSTSQNGSCWAANMATLTSLNLLPSFELADTDGDGLSDFMEMLLETDPKAADNREDGLTDAQAYTYFGSMANSSFDLFINGMRQTAAGQFSLDWAWYNRSNAQPLTGSLNASASYELQFSEELGQNAAWKTVRLTTGSSSGGTVSVDSGTPRGFFRLKLK